MKIKGKGEVCGASSSPSSSSPHKDARSVLKLLPAAILALASALSVEDREVLAYMITRSITTTDPSSITNHYKKKQCKRPNNAQKQHPLFECGCFDCYTIYWFRWDSSPNRELIHQAIEAFEDHLANNQLSKKHSSRAKKRDKEVGRRHPEKSADFSEVMEVLSVSGKVSETPENDVVPDAESDIVRENEEDYGVSGNLEVVVEVATVLAPASNHKGLARKVLPDVVGLLNSRLWSLWRPNI